MTEPQLDSVGVVRTLDLQPGDVLVVELDHPIPAAAVDRVVDALARRFPGHTCITLAPGVTLSVIRAGDVCTTD